MTDYSIKIDRQEHKLELYYDGVLLLSYPIAVGKHSTPTPVGNFKIINKAISSDSDFGARWMGIDRPGIGIHGTDNPQIMGRNISNGCISMKNSDILEMYQIVGIGTRVTIV